MNRKQGQSSRKRGQEDGQLVTFLLEEEEFGFDIMCVQEIIRLPRLWRIPRTPSYVDGIANLRGVVLPIIDVRTRFGMPRAEETDRTRVLVIDIDGVKTGLRVDRVRQVTRYGQGEIELPPAAIRDVSNDYLEGVVKLDNGQRIIMALNARKVCQIEVTDRQLAALSESVSESVRSSGLQDSNDDSRQMVSMQIGSEEYAFPMERVREIMRVTPPNQVPDAPPYVLGVLTVRGQILPIVDLRRVLQQRPLGADLAARCDVMRESYAEWLLSLDLTKLKSVAAEGSPAATLRNWLATFSTSSQALTDCAANLRNLNDRLCRQAAVPASTQEGLTVIRQTGEAIQSLLRRFSEMAPAAIQEDQRIVVVDSNGHSLGLVVDHVNEVLNVPGRSVEPPPSLAGVRSFHLEGIAKLDNGARLILLLDVTQLLGEHGLQEISSGTARTDTGPGEHAPSGAESDGSDGEVQLVTFMLGIEEFGIPISRIQEIDRLSRITSVPRAANYVEGVTNLRGEVIPVVDTRKRFAMDTRPADDRTRIIIVDLGGRKTGLIVDSVREVLNLPRKDVAPPPASVDDGVEQQFISGIGKVEQGRRMILLLDAERLLLTGTTHRTEAA